MYVMCLTSAVQIGAAFAISYVNYSNVAAKTLRRCLKSALQPEAVKRDQSFIRIFYWANGAILPPGQKPAESPDKGKPA